MRSGSDRSHQNLRLRLRAVGQTNFSTTQVDTMIEDAGVLIEEQRIRSLQATASRSAGDYPYTGLDHVISYIAYRYLLRISRLGRT